MPLLSNWYVEDHIGGGRFRMVKSESEARAFLIKIEASLETAMPIR